jgi:transcriptional regulator with XRE-family HTH domain
MQRDELLRSNGYWIAKIQMDLYNQILDYMKKNNLNRTQLAKKLGVTKGYITQVLNGEFNHRLSKLVELSLAIGRVPKIEYEDLDKFIIDDEIGYIPISWKLWNNKYEPIEYSNTTIIDSNKVISVKLEPSQLLDANYS